MHRASAGGKVRVWTLRVHQRLGLKRFGECPEQLDKSAAKRRATSGSGHYMVAGNRVIRILIVVDREHGNQNIEWLSRIICSAQPAWIDRWLDSNLADWNLKFSGVGLG